MSVVNRNNEVISSNKSQQRLLKCLYNTVLGRCFLKLLTAPFISKLVGRFMDSRLSYPLISPFVEKNNINLDDYDMSNVKTYNQFFTRKLKPNRRHIDFSPNALISPCDSKLSVYKISEDSIFNIKNSQYNIAELLGNNSALAQKYINGYCLIFRLEVDDYHRYCYFDSGYKSKNRFIKGVLHTVNPIALKHYNFYSQNCREFTILHTDNFGDVIQVEVGAMMVGKILNHHQKTAFKRGDEKGMFLFGGSTIVLLIQNNSVVIDEDIMQNSANNLETIVKYGEKIGRSISA